MPHSKVKIHFAGFTPGKKLIPIAQICGLGSTTFVSAGKYLNAYDELNERGREVWEPSDLKGADVVVFPHPYHSAPGMADQVAQLASIAGLPCVFFQHGDNSTPAKPPYGLVFRTSLFASKRSAQEHAMAAHTDDMLIGLEDLPLRTKQKRPVVGFCGNIGNLWLELLYRAIGRTQNVMGTALRRKVMRELQKSPSIECRFILRDRWWGGALTRRHQDRTAQQRLRDEYIDNIFSTDYMLCVRGAGNYSFRFYEALSACRIPLLVNTDCVLPFDNKIDWREHCLIVEECNLAQIGDRLIEYHESLSPEEFLSKQRANRSLWESRLKPLAFYQSAIEMAIHACAPRSTFKEGTEIS